MMSDVTIPCPHCGYRLLGTPGRYDTCQKCKKKIVWTKGRPYKTLTDVPNESHVINQHPTRRQHPPVPSTEYEPEQSSIMGFDGSEIFEFAQDHPVEPLNQKEKKKLAKEKKEQDHQKEEKKADVRVAPKWPNLPPLDDGTETLDYVDDFTKKEEREKRLIGWIFISALISFLCAGFLFLTAYLADLPELYIPTAVLPVIALSVQVWIYISTRFFFYNERAFSDQLMIQLLAMLVSAVIFYPTWFGLKIIIYEEVFKPIHINIEGVFVLGLLAWFIIGTVRALFSTTYIDDMKEVIEDAQYRREQRKSHGPTVDRILAEKKVKSELFRLKDK